MPECERGQIYRVKHVDARDGGYVISTEEGAVFGTLELPALTVGDGFALAATCGGWTQLVGRGRRTRAKIFKEPNVQPDRE